MEQAHQRRYTDLIRSIEEEEQNGIQLCTSTPLAFVCLLDCALTLQY